MLSPLVLFVLVALVYRSCISFPLTINILTKYFHSLRSINLTRLIFSCLSSSAGLTLRLPPILHGRTLCPPSRGPTLCRLSLSQLFRLPSSRLSPLSTISVNRFISFALICLIYFSARGWLCVSLQYFTDGLCVHHREGRFCVDFSIHTFFACPLLVSFCLSSPCAMSVSCLMSLA